jgi:hypothetical protein
MIVDTSVWNCNIMALKPEISTLIPMPMPNDDVGKNYFLSPTAIF